MGIRTEEQYRQSIAKQKPRVFIFGQKVDDVLDHPFIRGSVNAAALTFALANDPDNQKALTIHSPLIDEEINRYVSLHFTVEDLVDKVNLVRLISQKTGECAQRCMGWDAINALYSVTYETDAKHGTEYHQRFKKFLRRVQKEDLMVHGTMTDPRGDRSLKPAQQKDPDLYLRIVEKKPDGIVVRGAKSHQGGILNHEEFIVMPSVSLRPEDSDYAVSFALPVDTDGVTYVYGRHSMDLRSLGDDEFDMGNPKYGRYAMWVFFDNVFVPWERVFLCGESEYASAIVERFAGLHRQNYGACSAGNMDVLIGATSLIAKYNGIDRASIVRDKIIEMCHLSETMYQGSIACSAQGENTPSGVCVMNKLLSYITKLNVTRFPYEIARIAQDICGGIIATMPSEKDYRHPEIGPLLTKYLAGVSGIPTEHRMRIIRLIERMTCGRTLLVCMHGAGSPAAQKLMIGRYTDLEEKERLAKEITGIPVDEKPNLQAVRAGA
ncbi:MAG: 4-hydroxybutyryl-CoA dehydratase [Deltaproteobacteria bacterium]|nr:4-hydroxybutyryl-CoA dehydratase [Deltaproteobacteria bacterium]MBW2307858.1 4-hydroxybutyryl-CoA dehydratase [Deltaproteobacteria bacterium]